MDAKPEFFCAFIPKINAVRMRVCDAFLATLSSVDLIPKRVALRNRLGRDFFVEVRVENGRVYFDGGWPEFVSGNGLEVGYLLVFSFDGLQRFDVKIFDHSGCEKYICESDPVNYADEVNDDDEEEEDDEDENDSNDESDTISRAADFSGNNFKGHSGASVPCFPTQANTPKDVVMGKKEAHELRKPSGRRISQHRQDLRDIAVALFQPKNPYFVVDMQKQNVTKPTRLVYISREFAKKHLNKFSVQATLLDPDKRKWPVTVHYNDFRSEKSVISSGWSEFVQKNNLQIKDTCVFELVESNPLLLKVSIARKNN